ncbi:LPS assembly lipoprotein LptE [Catenovulum sediminis]|uniref:LPS-assembly lipoprotein LptE n=1 Tax=Catenovulum sediminis TaxID=1740262 RepID=A0ABV1RKJ3_9ALTE
MIKKVVMYLTLTLSVMLLTACGFQLRGSYAVPLSMQNICLDSQAAPLLGKELTKRLQRSNVRLTQDADCTKLNLISAELERAVLSLFPNAQVAEYELIYTVNYVLIHNSQPQQYSVQVVRDYQDDPDAVLAKSKEMKILLSELRRYAAEQILLQLASSENR